MDHKSIIDYRYRFEQPMRQHSYELGREGTLGQVPMPTLIHSSERVIGRVTFFCGSLHWPRIISLSLHGPMFVATSPEDSQEEPPSLASSD